MTTQTLTFPLSNLQLKLLQLFSQNVSEEDLKAIQRMIVLYFAEKATQAADADWVAKGYDADSLLKLDFGRTSPDLDYFQYVKIEERFFGKKSGKELDRRNV